jgi:hypothetical protein
MADEEKRPTFSIEEESKLVDIASDIVESSQGQIAACKSVASLEPEAVDQEGVGWRIKRVIIVVEQCRASA